MPKILLVEDNETNQEMLSYRLKRRGYAVLIAVDGAEALSLASAEKPDLILMDLSLPIMNGWEATTRIKANPDTKDIPIIALTAHAMGGDRQKALAAGCDDYSTKPIDFHRLIDQIKTLLRTSRSQADAVNTNPQSKSAVASSNLASITTVDAVIKKILLVEDDETNREMLSYRLKRRDYAVCIAVDGAEAVSLASAEKPDLILMDLSLPIMNGWEATIQIKANPDTKDIPVIALTAHAMSGDRQKALAAGCDDYSTKPIDFPQLIDKIRTLLKQESKSKLVKETCAANLIESNTYSELISEKKSKQKTAESFKSNVIEPLKALNKNLDLFNQKYLNPSPKDAKLLKLKQIIKLAYSPVGEKGWRTGSLAKLSQTRAQIYSKRMNLISLNTKIEIRFFISENARFSENIYAKVLEISAQEQDLFLVEFSSQYNQVIELLKTVV